MCAVKQRLRAQFHIMAFKECVKAPAMQMVTIADWCFSLFQTNPNLKDVYLLHHLLRFSKVNSKNVFFCRTMFFVNVVASIQYRALAGKASDAFYKLSNTRLQIQAYVFDVIRASVPKLNLDDVFEQKNDIAKSR
ncbi:hypothetical protein HPP92_006169 [Vanilla planifolia]|uniref:Uncharacterized protein n=1 Tax=Vanilla planifolia TaxID=51239 RepID=A0A835VFK1_VANPL|nr:hypothetical protein HPP92_006169 [Vanilla planifolia]